MRVVIIGAGRIGCGLAGQLLRESGHEVVFVARNPSLAGHFNRVGRYQVRLVGRGGAREVTVDGIRAVYAGETGLVVEEIATAGLIVTSVGCESLKDISGLLAAGIARRVNPVNVLAFENSGSAGSLLRGWVAQHLPKNFQLDRHGFSGVLISRAVTQRIGDPDSDTPLVFVGDSYSRIIVDAAGLRGTLPQIEGMLVTDNFEAWVQKKFAMFSAAHAATAYLGHLKGYRYIHTAIRDPQIRAAALAVMKEGQQGLAARFGKEIAGDDSDCREVLERIGNAQLCDHINRVGREPGRKLKYDDRLVGTGRLAEAAGVEPGNIGLAIAAALLFNNHRDSSAFELQHHLQSCGCEETVRKFCGVDNQSSLGRLAVDAWHRLSEGRQQGSVLLNLENMTWS